MTTTKTLWDCPVGCEFTPDKAAPFCYFSGTTNICHLKNTPYTGPEMTLSVKHSDLLVPGNQIGDTEDTCYLGIFKSSMS